MTSERYIKQQLQIFLRNHQIDDTKIVLQKPKEEAFGDYACNVALQLAPQLKKNPRQIAQEIVENFNQDKNYISKIEIAGPGFINFFISKTNLYQSLQNILTEKENFGKLSIGRNQKVLVEFVSANPTGPLTIGHGRQAVLGDTIANILETAGYEVTREYYFNNAGRQMRMLGESVRIRYLQLCGEKVELGDDHYQGEYIRDIAQVLYKKHSDQLKTKSKSDIFKTTAEQEIFKDIKNTLKNLGFGFDSFYNEKSLYDKGKIDKTVKNLSSKNMVTEKEGAIWFTTTKLGFEQDRVIIKSSGEPTYRLPDIAYHIEKFKRGYDLIIDIFGADHIDTYPDVLAALKVLGYDTDKVKVLIHQFVTLTEEGQKVKMSTRKANFVTLDDLINEVGADVTRYFFLMRGMNSHLNFDLKLAKTHSDENPVFYIQYAHARICSILSFAKEQKINTDQDNPELLKKLKENEEINLIKELIYFPDAIKSCVDSLEPQRLINYLHNLATTFHKFYTECRVISDNTELTKARLTLINATRIIISNGLSIMRINAPERM